MNVYNLSMSISSIGLSLQNEFEICYVVVHVTAASDDRLWYARP